MNLNVSGIYMMINIITDKNYIGSAANIRHRIKHHRYYLNHDKHHNRYVQNSWDKYGENAFIFVVLEKCATGDLIEREQFWLDIFKCFSPNDGYNIRVKAENSLGLKHTEETKKKMSINNVKWHRNNKKWPCSDGKECYCVICWEKKNFIKSEYSRIMREIELYK